VALEAETPWGIPRVTPQNVVEMLRL
jgi:hypothetical protein